MKHFTLLLTAMLFFISCGGGSTTISTTPQEQTDECTYSKQVCKDARDFQTEFNQMPKEQQEEMIHVLNSLIEQCERTRKMCKDSQK